MNEATRRHKRKEKTKKSSFSYEHPTSILKDISSDQGRPFPATDFYVWIESLSFQPPPTVHTRPDILSLVDSPQDTDRASHFSPRSQSYFTVITSAVLVTNNRDQPLPSVRSPPPPLFTLLFTHTITDPSFRQHPPPRTRPLARRPP